MDQGGALEAPSFPKELQAVHGCWRRGVISFSAVATDRLFILIVKYTHTHTHTEETGEEEVWLRGLRSERMMGGDDPSTL